jgi:Na+/melibiose symporter-like transporter
MRLIRSTLYYYALPAFSLAMLGLPLYIYLPTFYTQYVGLSTLEVGLVLFFARTLDLLFDPLIGSLSDRYAKRKVMMFVGMVILIAGFFALSYPLKSWIWLLGFSFVAYSGWSLMSIPYLALSAELSRDYHDNTRLASTRELFAILGLVSALVLPYALGIAEDSEATMRLMLLVVGLSLPLLFLLFAQKIKEPERVSHPLKFLIGLKYLWSNTPDARSLFLAFFTNSLANALPATLFLFFVSLVLQTPEQTGAFLLLYFISGLVALPVWLYLAKSWGKKRTWIVSMVLASVAFSFVPLLESGDGFYFLVITLVSGFSLGADMALPAAIQADIAQSLEGNGQRLTGVLFGFWAMLTKLSLAFAVGISFGLLGLMGFDPELPTSNALSMLSLLYGLAPVLFKVAAIFFISKYDDAV